MDIAVGIVLIVVGWVLTRAASARYRVAGNGSGTAYTRFGWGLVLVGCGLVGAGISMVTLTVWDVVR